MASTSKELSLPPGLSELLHKVSRIEYNIMNIVNHCKVFGEMFDKVVKLNKNNISLYNHNMEILKKLISVVEENIQLIKNCAQFVHINDDEDDDDEDDDDNDSDYGKAKILDSFMKIKRECPICFNLFPTQKLIFAPCSHFCCCDCFDRLENFKCSICMAKISVCIQYEKNGDNLKYSTILITERPTYTDFCLFDRIIQHSEN